MQRHKRDSCTHSFWHQVFYTYCTSLLPPHLIYCTKHNTKQDWSSRTLCREVLEFGFSLWCSLQRPCATFSHLSLFCSSLKIFLLYSVDSLSVFIPVYFEFLRCFQCCCFAPFILFCTYSPSAFSTLLSEAPLPHRVLSLSFFK